MKVFFWVQHLLGIGHLRRTLSLARATAAAGIDTVVGSGGMPVPGADPGGAKLVQLPPVRAVDRYFKELVGERDRPIDDAWRDRRREALLEAYEAAGPDAVVTELFPFGRRQLRFELEPLLARAQADGCTVISSVRDILVEPDKPERVGEMIERVEQWYDLVLVHGDPEFVPFDVTFPRLGEIAPLVRYTGYAVDRVAAPPSGDGAGEVLVSAGGGAVGEPLLRAALAARPLSTARDRRWRFLVGEGLPEAVFADLVRAAPPGVVVERARPDFQAMLGRAHLSVSQGGYNTVMEVLAAGLRAVVAPYAGGHESEQTLRAGALAERGALQVVGEDELSPDRLAAAIDRALAGPPVSAAGIDLGGIPATVALLRDLDGR